MSFYYRLDFSLSRFGLFVFSYIFWFKEGEIFFECVSCLFFPILSLCLLPLAVDNSYETLKRLGVVIEISLFVFFRVGSSSAGFFMNVFLKLSNYFTRPSYPFCLAWGVIGFMNLMDGLVVSVCYGVVLLLSLDRRRLR